MNLQTASEFTAQYIAERKSFLTSAAERIDHQIAMTVFLHVTGLYSVKQRDTSLKQIQPQLKDIKQEIQRLIQIESHLQHLPDQSSLQFAQWSDQFDLTIRQLSEVDELFSPKDPPSNTE